MSQLLTGSDLLDSFKKEPQKEPQPFDTLVPVAVLRQVSFPYTFSTPNAPLPPASLPVEAQVSSEKNSPAPQAPLSQANIESSTKAGVSRQLKAKIASLKAASRSSSVQPSVRPSVRPSAQSSVQVSQTGPAPSQTGPATDSARLPVSNKGQIRPTTLPSRVYGGYDYKALQSKAAEGGLVNLDDALLFGGIDSDTNRKGPTAGRGVNSRDKAPKAFDYESYLSEPLEDFTASPIKGGFHPTAHLYSDSSQSDLCTVLDATAFNLSGLTEEALAEEALAEEALAELAESRAVTIDGINGENSELGDLTKQISQLSQEIEYLNTRLAELSAKKFLQADLAASASPAANRRHSVSDKSTASPDSVLPDVGRKVRRHPVGLNSVVLNIEDLQLEDPAQAEQIRVATLEPLPQVV